MTLLDRLETAAKEASPGTWYFDSGNCEVEVDGDRNHIAYVGNSIHQSSPRLVDWISDGEYIATANPTNILKLVAAVREMEGTLDWYAKLEEASKAKAMASGLDVMLRSPAADSLARARELLK